MGSYESEVKEARRKGEKVDGKIDVTFIKYFCQTLPLNKKIDNLPYFFKKVSLLNTFTDTELWQLSKFLHRRSFGMDELVFKQGDSGYGFYFIYEGSVKVFTEVDNAGATDFGDFIIQLEKYQYFGEMGLLEEFNRRSATVIAAEKTVLLGIFKPDLEDLIENYPVVGAKFLREISLVMATRMGQMAEEVIKLKKRNTELEEMVST